MRILNKLLLASMLVSSLGLGGCASVHSDVAVEQNTNIDSMQVAAIEHVAKERGVKVYWLHYPQKQ